MNPALWGAFTALGWGGADFIARFTGRRLGHDRALFGMLCVSALVMVVIFWSSGEAVVTRLDGLFLLFAAGLGILTATFFLYWGLARGPVSVVSPIVASYPAVNVALAVGLGSRLSGLQWLSIAVVMAGVLVVVRSSKSFERSAHYDPGELRKTIWISVASSLFFGVSIAAGQEAATIYGELQTTMAARWIGMIALGLVLLSRRGERRPGPRSIPVNWWLILAVQGLLDGGAYVALFAASHGPNAEIAAVVASAFSAITVVLARIFLREAMTALQWAGIAMILGGVAVLVARG